MLVFNEPDGAGWSRFFGARAANWRRTIAPSQGAQSEEIRIDAIGRLPSPVGALDLKRLLKAKGIIVDGDVSSFSTTSLAHLKGIQLIYCPMLTHVQLSR
jgi:hypothetical protein